MSPRQDRRAFLQSSLAGAAGLALFPNAIAREKPSALSVTALAEGLVMISGAGANVVAARGPEGITLVDGGLQERSAELLKLVSKELGGARVTTLFNTHWHPEQTGSNTTLGKAGAKIIAHENTRLWLGYPNPLPDQPNRTYGPLPEVALPNDTTYDSGHMTLGPEEIDYGYLLQAHTDGDLYVFFHNANVLVTGGVVSGEGWPIIDYKTGGWIGGLVQGLATLVKVANAQTRIVPANGPVLTRADLEAQRDMYAQIFDRLQKLLRQGMGPDEAVAAAPAKEYEAKWGDASFFLNQAFRSMWGHFAPDA
ncbi:MAG TPA: MBL fold metallo-hydrolase [Steroidobacteraceae bacterium]